MDFEEKIRSLVNSARMEQPPKVNIVKNVLSALSYHSRECIVVSERQMMWVALCSSAAAAVIIIAAFASYHTTADLISEVSQAISWVVQ
jgi:hypothetical protein